MFRSIQRKCLSQFQLYIKHNNPGFCWEHSLVSIVLSLGIPALIFTSLKIPETYSQLTVGTTAWQAQTKLQDYLLLISFVIVFFLAYLLVYLLSCLITKNNGNSAEKEFRSLLVLSTLPAWLWLSRLFLNPAFNLPMLFCAIVSISLVIIFSAIAAIKKLKFFDEQEFINCVGTNVLIIFGTGLASIGIAIAMSRIKIGWQLKDIKSTVLLLTITTLISFLILLLIWLYHRGTVSNLLKKIRILCLLTQALMPLAFLAIIPTPWQISQSKLLGYPLNPTLAFLIAALMSLAYSDLFKRIKYQPYINKTLIKSALSPLCLTGLLFWIKLPVIGVSSINPDDYHNGEFLLPWWLSKSFSYIPFHDYTPARGLVNYLPGFLADIFFDGTAPSQSAATGILVFLFLSLGFLVVSRSIGTMPAFLAFLLMPVYNGFSEIDITVTIVLCLLCELFLKVRSADWLVFWVVLGTGLILFAPGQGGLLIFATIPLGLVSLGRAFRRERLKLLYYVAYGVFVALILALFTPLGQMVFGAVLYLLEQSSINSTAYGIPWSNMNKMKADLPINWFWEAIRASWIVVAIIAGLLIVRAVLKPNISESKRLLVFAVPIALLVILFIPRAAGRIDPGPSRLGIATIWSFSLLLPILLLSAYDYLKKPLILVLTAFAGGLLAPSFGLPEVSAILEKPTIVAFSGENFTDGNDIGMPNLGKGIVDGQQLNRLKSIHHVLSKVLDSGETYLDLTNHNAHYFYLGYPPPIEAGAVYNLVHDNQQLRSVEKLKNKQPPVVLVSADNMLFDGGTAALRSHLIYRYVVLNYVPVKVDGFIYMVRPDRLARFQSLGADTSLSHEEQLSLLDGAFRMQDLQALPIAWGRSFKTLKSQLRPVSQINEKINVVLNSVKRMDRNTYQVTGSDPYIVFLIDSLKLNGKDAGILAFDFSCHQGVGQPILNIHWGSKSAPRSEATVVQFKAENGKLLIPLDAAPRWLNAKSINSIRFDIDNPETCSTFFLSNIVFSQRSVLSP